MAGSAVQAVGSLFGGINAQRAYNDRARQLRKAADQTNMEAGVTASNAMQDAARAEASAFVESAAGGGFTGSAVDVLNDFNAAQLFNARSIVYRGLTQARNAEYEARVAKAQGRGALTEGIFSAASSLLGGYSDYRASKAGVS